jgi:branched-chain amino acid transport system substrate-binding protein
VNLRGWLGTSLFALGVVAVSSLTGCQKLGGGDGDKGAGSGTASGTGASVAPETGPIKIGHYASMTGSEATFGVSTDNAIRLAVEEKNAAGGIKGRKIELITADTASKASEGGTVVTKLITSDKVVALLGEVASSTTMAGGDVAQKLGIPNISPSSTNVRVTEIGDMISRVCFTDDFQAWVVAKFAFDNLKVKKAAIMYDQGQAYSKGLAEYFAKSFKELGGTIVANVAYTNNNPDASAQLQTIKSSGAEAVFLPGYYSDAANYMKQAKAKGVTIPFLGADGWDSSELFKIGGSSIDGNYFSNHYSHEEQRPEVQSFVVNYQKKFGAVPDGLAALGYDAARVLFDAMERAPSLDGKALAAAINSTKDFPGVTGRITIDPKRNALKKAVVLKIEKGAAHLIADIYPPGLEPAAGTGSGAGSAAVGSAAAPDPAKDTKSADPAPAPAPGAATPDKGKADEAAAKPKQAAPGGGGGGTKADPDEGGE